MAIIFNCSGCKRQLRAKEEAAGRKARCPQCGTVTEIPVPSSQTHTRDDDEGPVQYGLAGAPEAAAAPPPLPEATRPCPYCSETIPAVASECEYCGEVLEPPVGAPSPRGPRRRRRLPYTHAGDTFGIGTCVSQGWETMKDHYGLFVGVSVALLGIQMAINVVDAALDAVMGFSLIGLLAGFLLIPHFTAGQLYVGIKAFRGQRPTFDDFLAGFRRYGTVAGAFFLFMLVFFGCVIVAGLAIALSTLAGVALNQPVVAVILIGGGIVLSIVLIIYFAMRFFFVLQFAIDGKNLGIMDCFHESSRITEGRKLHLFAFAVVVGLLVSLTAVCGCVIGAFLLGYPLQMGAFGAAYCLLCRESE